MANHLTHNTHEILFMFNYDLIVSNKIVNKIWKILNTSETRIAQSKTVVFNTTLGPITAPTVAGILM